MFKSVIRNIFALILFSLLSPASEIEEFKAVRLNITQSCPSECKNKGRTLYNEHFFYFFSACMFSVFIMTGTFKSFGVLYVELLSIFHSSATMASIVQGLLIFTNSIVCEYNDIAERISAKLCYPKYQKANHTIYCHYYNKKQRC